MTTSTDWQTLIQKHLDGQTTEEEANTLSRKIETDASVRSEYLNAARVHSVLCNEVISLDLDSTPSLSSDLHPIIQVKPRTKRFTKPLAAAIVVGAVAGLLGAGVVGAISSPLSEAKMISIFIDDFEDSSGPIELGFPAEFGNWSGDPAEVVEAAGENRMLRFLETANVTNTPNGRTSACNVFQLIDLSSIQQRWNTKNQEFQVTLELSAKFRREAASTDPELPKLSGVCTIHLYHCEPESIGKNWPLVIQDAVAIGNQTIKLKPGEEAQTISASCLLDPRATIALISLNVNSRIPTTTPIKLGGYYADNVRLTLTKSPKHPVKVVNK
ncbi:MAG: hypothetical protein QMB90_09305 [Rubritalea sp.]|jgi:hypothetical protein